MISMTGFAQGSFSCRTSQYRLEMKSLNHRFLDVKVRLPRELQSLDFEIRQWAEKNVKRGSLEILVEKVSESQGPDQYLGIDEAKMDEVVRTFRQWEHRYQLSGGIRLEDVLRTMESLKREPGTSSDSGKNELKEALWAALQTVLSDFNKMKQAEGSRLREFFHSQVKELQKLHSEIAPRRFELKEKQKEKVRKKIENCFEAYTTIDAQMRALMESRIATEIAIQLERSDFEEEFVRFESHLKELHQYLETEKVSGKKLDFFYQELGREVNTMGNKALDIQMSQTVIQVKTLLEQMREQSLNLE